MFDFEPEFDTLDGVPEQYHALYSQGDDGKFTLDSKLAERLNNGAGAAKALRDERKTIQALNRQIALYKAIGETPEAITEKIADLEESANKASGADERVAKVRADLEKTHAGQLKAFEKEIEDLKESLRVEQAQSDTEYLQREISDAVSATDAIPAALRPILRERLKIERDDEGRKIKVLDDKGEQVLDGRGDPITVKGFAERLKATDDFGFAFKPSGNRGGGTGTSPHRGPAGQKNPFAKETLNLTEQGVLIKTNPDRARAFAQQAGHPVTW